MKRAYFAAFLCPLLAACSTISPEQLAAYGNETSHCKRDHSLTVAPGPFGGWPPATVVSLHIICDPADRVFETPSDERSEDVPAEPIS